VQVVVTYDLPGKEVPWEAAADMVAVAVVVVRELVEALDSSETASR